MPRSRTSRKIGQLHHEGYPHKQAIRIGLEQERKGTIRIHRLATVKAIQGWVKLGLSPRQARDMVLHDVNKSTRRNR